MTEETAPVVVSDTVQEWRGKRYRNSHEFGYYQRSGGTLHRAVWRDCVGPIEDGVHIHHKNGDPSDNRLSNLEAVPAGEHVSMHQTQPTEDWRARRLEHLRKVHQSMTREDYSRAGKKAWEGREPVEAVCVVCGDTYETYYPTRAMYCGNKCKMRAFYARQREAVDA